MNYIAIGVHRAPKLDICCGHFCTELDWNQTRRNCALLQPAHRSKKMIRTVFSIWNSFSAAKPRHSKFSRENNAPSLSTHQELIHTSSNSRLWTKPWMKS